MGYNCGHLDRPRATHPGSVQNRFNCDLQEANLSYSQPGSMPSSFFCSWENEKTLIPFALAFTSYWLLHLNTQHVFTIITVYVVTWLPTRKRLCACADNCPAIIVKGFIDKRWELLSWREVLIWLFINGWRVRCFIIIALSKHGRVLCD